MARRAWGAGSLYKRSSDGRWIGRVSDGQGGHRYVTGKDRDTVRSRLRALSRSSRTARSRETTGEVIERWLDDSRHLRARTRDEYQRMSRLHVGPAIGAVLLSELSPQDIQRMVGGMVDRGYSAQTAKHAHKLVRVVLGDAVRTGLVDRNVAALVKAPRVTRKPLQALTAAETRHLLTATRDEPLWPLWALAATTGMRQAELLGLRWQDVSLPRSPLLVETGGVAQPSLNESIQKENTAATATVQGPASYPAASVTVNVVLRAMGDDQWALEEPKTERSRRTLPLSPLGIEALRLQKERATSAMWVFARADGRPLDRSWVTRLFQDALSRHGLPRVRFHDMRHAAAHMMLDELGGDIRAVSSYLGHSTISTTVDIYGGRADEARKRAAEAIGRALEGNG